MNTSSPPPAPRPDVSGVDVPQRVELRGAVERLFSRVPSLPRIVALDTRPLPYASSFAIEEVNVRFEDGSTMELVCKDTGEAAMLPEARQIKPRFLYHPLRETATYEQILGPFKIDAPRFYGSAIDEGRGRYWLFVERVPGVPLTEIGDFTVWKRVSGWLAWMHRRVTCDPGLARAVAAVPLVQYDRTLAQAWMQRAQWYLHADATQPRSGRLRFAALLAHHEDVLDEIAALPAGFVHGDFFASNVLVEVGPNQVRVRPVDWEVAGIGPLLMDLATLTAGGWTEDQRARLVIAYYEVIGGEGSMSLSYGDFMRALDCCRLQLAVQRLGWARKWTPPATHTQDWLGEALRAADRLGL